jgi:hypothetical protein
MNKIILPIYYTQEFKRKDPKTWLVGDNAYRNWHYFLKNQVKKHYHILVDEQVGESTVPGQYRLAIDLYLKNPNSDASNVASRIEKFTLDALQESGVVVEDNSKYHLGTTWEFKGIDKTDPRAEVTLIELL